MAILPYPRVVIDLTGKLSYTKRGRLNLIPAVTDRPEGSTGYEFHIIFKKIRNIAENEKRLDEMEAWISSPYKRISDEEVIEDDDSLLCRIFEYKLIIIFFYGIKLKLKP